MLGPAFLARQNNVVCHFLNRVFNGCFISPKCNIPNSIILPHGKVVIGDGVKLGENIKIYQNVTLGEYREKYPVIEDNATIYPNSVIVGDVTIKKNSRVKAMSLVYPK